MTLSFCGEIVRKHDPDRFLLSLFAPVDKRAALWALYAFNYEVARTREVVTETQLGLIRLQWWRDALAGSSGGNPILDDLRMAMQEHDLPKNLFDNLIYAREFDLEDRQPADMHGMINYADFTSTPLLELAQRILGGQGDVKDIAIGYALTGLLRAVPTHLRQRRCLLPANMTPPVERLYEGQELEKLKPVVREIAMAAQARLSSPKDRFAKGHAVLSKMYLKQIEWVDYDLFDPRLNLPPLARGLRVWWALL